MNPASTFQLDDDVEVIESGYRFRISQIWKNEDGSIDYSARGALAYRASSLKKVDELHVGDYAKVLSIPREANDYIMEMEKTIGKTYEVKQIQTRMPTIGLGVPGAKGESNLYWYEPGDLQKVDGPELKIGDLVEVIGQPAALSGEETGQIAQIVTVDDDDEGPAYLVHGSEFYYRPSSLRKLTPEEVAEHTSTIGYKMRECTSELEKANAALRDVLAPLVDERLSVIEKQQAEIIAEVSSIAIGLGRTLPGNWTGTALREALHEPDVVSKILDGPCEDCPESHPYTGDCPGVGQACGFPWSIELSRGEECHCVSGYDVDELVEFVRRMLDES